MRLKQQLCLIVAQAAMPGTDLRIENKPALTTHIILLLDSERLFG